MRAVGCIFRASGREREKRVEEQTGVPNNLRAMITCLATDLLPQIWPLFL